MAKATTQASAPKTVASTTTAGDPAPAATTEKAKYETLLIGVGKTHKATKDKLEALADKLSCKASGLVWLAIEQMLANPPKVAPEGATPNTGSAAGFWVRPLRDKAGKAHSAEVVEVETRGDVTDGSTFYRYSREDAKERNRALNQAKRGAAYMMNLLGAPGEPKVKELEAV